jgi:hypothetical protein
VWTHACTPARPCARVTHGLLPSRQGRAVWAEAPLEAPAPSLVDSFTPGPALQKGAAATEAWTEARKRTTPAGLGGMVYAKLLK